MSTELNTKAFVTIKLFNQTISQILNFLTLTNNLSLRTAILKTEIIFNLNCLKHCEFFLVNKPYLYALAALVAS